MENIQQTTQAQTLVPPEMSNGGNSEKVKKIAVGFQQTDKKPVDTVTREVEQVEESKETIEKKEEVVEKADEVISVVNNKLKIVSDDRSKTGLVVKILNRDSGDVIKQFPSDEVLNMAVRLKDSVVGVIVDDKA